jgi:hypothetical protein
LRKTPSHQRQKRIFLLLPSSTEEFRRLWPRRKGPEVPVWYQRCQRHRDPFRRHRRVAALQKRWDYLRAGLDLILDQRGADMADLPGGSSELLVRDFKGKKLIGG